MVLRATIVLPRGSWQETPADVVVLDYDARHRRRIRMQGVHGLDFLLDLETALMLRHGDALKLEDGRLIEVVAEPEPLIEISCPDITERVRIAWHLGNRHVPVEINGAKLRIRHDRVLLELLQTFKRHNATLRLRAIEAPFEPEGGAYVGHEIVHDEIAHDNLTDRAAPGHDHGDHTHDHSHNHAHRHG